MCLGTRKATLNQPSLTVCIVSVDVKQHPANPIVSGDVKQHSTNRIVSGNVKQHSTNRVVCGDVKQHSTNRIVCGDVRQHSTNRIVSGDVKQHSTNRTVSGDVKQLNQPYSVWGRKATLTSNTDTPEPLSCVNREVGVGYHSLSHSSSDPNKPYVCLSFIVPALR